VRRYLNGKSMDDVAIARIREFEPEALRMHPNGYWLAFSGGKDSVVILDLTKRADVSFEAHYNLTTVDPPELVHFIKTFPEVRIDRPPLTMWQLIRKEGMPPRRNARFCCQELKERGGTGRLTITGVRWGESNRRAKRQMREACYRDKTKRYLHPIIDWPTDAVWEYIRERRLRYCSLYDEGFERLGCVLCPMTSDIERHLARWPKLCAGWERAIKSTFRPGYVSRSGTTFASAEEYWRWWLDRNAPARRADDAAVLFEDDPAATEAARPPTPLVEEKRPAAWNSLVGGIIAMGGRM